MLLYRLHLCCEVCTLSKAFYGVRMCWHDVPRSQPVHSACSSSRICCRESLPAIDCYCKPFKSFCQKASPNHKRAASFQSRFAGVASQKNPLSSSDPQLSFPESLWHQEEEVSEDEGEKQPGPPVIAGTNNNNNNSNYNHNNCYNNNNSSNNNNNNKYQICPEMKSVRTHTPCIESVSSGLREKTLNLPRASSDLQRQS